MVVNKSNLYAHKIDAGLFGLSAFAEDKQLLGDHRQHFDVDTVKLIETHPLQEKETNKSVLTQRINRE